MTEIMYDRYMNRFAYLAIALLFVGLPAAAQQDGTPDSGEDSGLSLMQQGAQLLLRGLLDEVQPQLDDLGAKAQEFAQEIEPALRLLSEEMGPAIAAMLDQIDNIANYEGPVFLENGDILIRRKPDAPPYVPPPPVESPQGEIDL